MKFTAKKPKTLMEGGLEEDDLENKQKPDSDMMNTTIQDFKQLKNPKAQFQETIFEQQY